MVKQKVKDPEIIFYSRLHINKSGKYEEEISAKVIQRDEKGRFKSTKTVKIDPLEGSRLQKSLQTAGVTLDDIDAIAVTYGAGLAGALMVGVNFAKGLAFATNKPLVAVNHIKGHISANYIQNKNLQPPFICLVVSGGHTAILRVDDYLNHTFIGDFS